MLAAMEDNKQIALNVLKGAFIDRDPSVVGRYFPPGYTQHNPSLPDGPGPIRVMIAGLSKTFQYEPGRTRREREVVTVEVRALRLGAQLSVPPAQFPIFI